MSTYKISIAKPCSEDWDRMLQTDQGKHCSSCNKVVVDFSNMSNTEIMVILLKNKGNNLCGNFRNTQIERPINYIIQKNHRHWYAIGAMLVAGVFSVSVNVIHAQNNHVQFSYNEPLRTDEKRTEPSKDSLTTYTIKILSKKDKVAIVGANIMIEGIGSFITDNKGSISFSIDATKISGIVNIQLSAIGYNNEHISINKQRIVHTKKIELWMTEREEFMLKGDVSIEQMH